MVRIGIQAKVSCPRLDRRRIRRAVREALALGGVRAAEVTVAVVDDPTIHELNRRHLAHDYPTDVLSFLIEENNERLEGDVVVSLDTATREAPRYGWSAQDELLLYIVHGTLHLVGFDDRSPADKSRMQAAECTVLAKFGLTPLRDERRLDERTNSKRT